MPPRRSHKKSRMGCSSCKRRRVKCDEEGPPCGPCAARQIECSYSSVFRGNKAHHDVGFDEINPPFQVNGAKILPDAGVKDSNRLLELELMHQWSTETYKGLAGGLETDFEAWQTFLPQEGFRHRFLLDELLAMAALEKVSNATGAENSRYYRIALEYHDRASTQFRHELSNPTPDKENALFAFSSITLALSLALPCIGSSDEPGSVLSNMLPYFEILRGAGAVTLQFWPRIQSSPLLRDKKPFHDVEMRPLEDDIETSLGWLNAMNEGRYRLAYNQSQAAKLSIFTNYTACKKAIFFLGEHFSRCGSRETKGYSLAWPMMAGKEYMAAVESKDSVALLTLMHWGVLINECIDDIWWARTVGLRLVKDVINVLPHDSDPVVRACIDLAKCKVGLS